jgi:hypothetical protein
MQSWMRKLFPATRRSHKPAPRAARLEVETLESRLLLNSGPLTPIAPGDAFVGNNADNVAQQEQLYGSTNFPSSQVEPYVAVNPRDHKNIVSVWQQDRWSDGASRGFQGGVSTDGGKTWTEIVIPGISQVSGGSAPRATDPWVSFSPDGAVYCNSLGLDPATGAASIMVSKSNDGGFTWGSPIVVNADADPTINGDLATYPFNDKESLTADPTNSRYVYSVWVQFQDTYDSSNNFLYEDGPVLFSRSADGGKTWEPSKTIYDPATTPLQVGDDVFTQGNRVLVQPDGTLVELFNEGRYDPNSNLFIFTLKDIRSTDHGATWSKPYTLAHYDETYEETWFNRSVVADADNPNLAVRTGDILPSFEVDPRNGNLYAVWQDGTHGSSSNSPVVIQLAMSTDGGKTWTDPVQANRTPTNIPVLDQQAFTPSIAVANNGTVAITYYDFRNNTPAPGLLTDAWAITVNPDGHGGLTNPKNWGNEIRLTSSSFDMELAPVSAGGRGFFVGDYEGLVAVNGNTFLAVFIQAGTAGAGTSAAYSRSFGPSDSAPATGASATIQAASTLDFGNDGSSDPLTPGFKKTSRRGHS